MTKDGMFKKNSKENGQYHSNWLNMMMPRLYLAKNLLKQDGVIFMSIDDNEVHNLRLLMNEIFGEENFVGQLIWKSRQNKDNRNITGLSIDHEYVLCYSKTNGIRVLKGAERKIEQYKNPDNDERGPWVSGNMVGLLPEDQRRNCHYDLVNPETGINYGKPKMGWRYEKKFNEQAHK
jgi:adenine-specific DNA-methyltransferase